MISLRSLGFFVCLFALERAAQSSWEACQASCKQAGSGSWSTCIITGISEYHTAVKQKGCSCLLFVFLFFSGLEVLMGTSGEGLLASGVSR